MGVRTPRCWWVELSARRSMVEGLKVVSVKLQSLGGGGGGGGVTLNPKP